MGGTDFKWGGRAPLPPPLATALRDKVIIHSPQSSPLSLELGTPELGVTNVNETHILQNDQGAVES